jgi:hypothetical protein
MLEYQKRAMKLAMKFLISTNITAIIEGIVDQMNETNGCTCVVGDGLY